MSLRTAALLAVLGALGIATTGTLTGAPGLAALGWAAVAAVGLGTMLRGPGLRILGGLAVLLALAAGVTSVVVGGGTLMGVVGAVALAAAGVGAVASGGRWRRGVGAGPRPAPEDPWKRFDAGDDPTDER